MPLPHQTLVAIQSAGAAIFAADMQLRTSVQDYAEQVKTAMQQNPFDLGNDSLFEDWKTAARLSQAISAIEVEFKKIYGAAADLSSGSGTTLTMQALSAPSAASSQELELLREIHATDAVIKRPHRNVRKGTARQSATPKPLRGNAAKVLDRMRQLLNHRSFVKVNQSALALEVGLPKGSIGASMTKLLQTGYIVQGPAGGFKLDRPKG